MLTLSEMSDIIDSLVKNKFSTGCWKENFEKMKFMLDNVETLRYNERVAADKRYTQDSKSSKEFEKSS